MSISNKAEVVLTTLEEGGSEIIETTLSASISIDTQSTDDVDPLTSPDYTSSRAAAGGRMRPISPLTPMNAAKLDPYVPASSSTKSPTIGATAGATEPSSRQRSSTPTTSHVRSRRIDTTTSTSNTKLIRPKSYDFEKAPLNDVLTSVRDKIESLALMESTTKRGEWNNEDDDEQAQLRKENLRRTFQQSISSAVLTSLAHKRYERRRLAAMEIEKVVRTLVYNRELDRVRAILLLLSDDYVRSANEDARKGGVVALAACAIGLKKANEMEDLSERVNECKDLILASVVHACMDNSQRVRYYATESLFNVIKVIPSLAVEHFFIMFEILRSLWADVDMDVKSGAELLDKKLKEVIIGSINSGQFQADDCVPLFARFLHMRNKPTKKLTLTWLQEFSEKLIGAPLLEYLHLFLCDIFTLIADPNSSIRQGALMYLNSVLPQMLMINEDFEDAGSSNKVDFDKILQSLVTTMEHPDPFVRKVAMYWMSRIVQAHINDSQKEIKPSNGKDNDAEVVHRQSLSPASISVRNSLPHVLPGLLLSIGDTFQMRTSAKDAFLPEHTTHSLAQQTNKCLQDTVRSEGKSYVEHLYGFVVVLREELDTPGGLSGKNRSAIERKPYRMDIKADGTGIESTGWFRAVDDTDEEGVDKVNILSRVCALEWVIILYESVVPESLQSEVRVNC